jgi:carboxyl-terminal processing protease
MHGQRAVQCAILPRRRSELAVRVRAWLLACATLLILLVPVVVAGTAAVRPDRGPSTLAADIPYGEFSAAPSQASSASRQAYDLLLDNFVTPPAPSSLLALAATEVGRRAADRKPGNWANPTIADNATRDEAWAVFDTWLDSLAVLTAPVVDRSTLDEIAIKAMAVAVAEHHTRYLDPRQNEEHQAWRRGEVRYEGIGARLRRPSTVVLEVFDNSPAWRAGLKTGDRIISVDGHPVADQTSEVAISKIRGPLGSTVEVVVERRGSPEPLHFSLERAEIKMPFVRWDVLQRADGRKIGYIQIRGFPEPSVDERVGQALADLDKRGIDGLVLDLRGNSGGRIDVGMKVASRFVREGVIFQQVDRSGRERMVKASGSQYWERSTPMIALVDGGTASMGEILGSALQEAGVARVVGTTTAGSVAGARLFPLANGGALQITVLTITSGRGSVLNDIGVKPDVTIDLTDDDLLRGLDAQLESGIQNLFSRPSRAGLFQFLAPSMRGISA